MRLIDADEFKRQIAGMAIINNFPADKANAMCELIDSQHTAYDVDNVVEKLKYNIISQIGKDEVIRIPLDKAIEIVKGGGVNGD